jgi:hypothetical protein
VQVRRDAQRLTEGVRAGAANVFRGDDEDRCRSLQQALLAPRSEVTVMRVSCSRLKSAISATCCRAADESRALPAQNKIIARILNVGKFFIVHPRSGFA